MRFQNVPVLGHHEDRDEVDHSQGQELSLLTVLLCAHTHTHTSTHILFDIKSRFTSNICVCLSVTNNVSEDHCTEAVDVHVL